MRFCACYWLPLPCRLEVVQIETVWCPFWHWPFPHPWGGKQAVWRPGVGCRVVALGPGACSFGVVNCGVGSGCVTPCEWAAFQVVRRSTAPHSRVASAFLFSAGQF